MSKNQSVVFKVLPSEQEARDKFQQDGTLGKNSDSGHLALRQMLDEPISQNILGKFAAKIQVLDIFMCWIDIQEYKFIPTDSYRRSKGLHIYHKYIKEDAALMVGVTTPAERQQIWSQLQTSRDLPTLLTPQFYDHVQSRCFIQMDHHIYLPFKETAEYKELNNQLKNKYNRVKLSDFDYFNKLGEGGFGFVIHCKKKSTGRHYAMKIQSKTALLDCYHDEPLKVLLEKDAFASLQHPFIVNLYYAFQTPELAIMVLDLADCGDLHSCLANSSSGRLSEERVKFYIAEIVLALAYLHQRGLIYRDLKPQNVLLNADGHVQLVDLGGILDDDGAWTRRHREGASLLPLFSAGSMGKKIEEGEDEDGKSIGASYQENSAPKGPIVEDTPSILAACSLLMGDEAGAESNKPQTELDINRQSEDNAQGAQASPTGVDEQVLTPGIVAPSDMHPVTTAVAQSVEKRKKAKRKQSIMGTMGYMAPEMVLMLSGQQMSSSGSRIATRKMIKRGYTSAVDWWSLGVTMYKLLTGVRPFSEKDGDSSVDTSGTIHKTIEENSNFKDYTMLFQKINFPSYLSPQARDLLSSLLEVDESLRLGSGKDGSREIKRHPFFLGIDWDLLEQKQVEPPFKPTPPASSVFSDSSSNGSDLRAILTIYGKANLMEQVPSDSEQSYFETWDFISPHTLRVEAGLSMMMEQLVTNPKARRIMGESDKVDNSRPTEKSKKM